MEEHKRQVLSFVRRMGRVRKTQQYALENYWDTWVQKSTDGPFEYDKKQQSALVLEIGFGMGQSLIVMAKAHPNTHYIGVEVHRPGIGALLHHAVKEDLKNLSVYAEDVHDVLHHALADHSLDGVQIFFPDPWPKKRHHKRRLVQEGFASLLAQKVKRGGFLHIATDWQPYADDMLEMLNKHTCWQNRAQDGGFCKDAPGQREETKFEKRGQDRAHAINDLYFINQATR